MSLVLTETRPSTVDAVAGSSRDRWMAVIFNNDTNSMDEVVEALMDATHCDEEEAYIEAWEAHTYGKAAVHFASFDECHQVCGSLSTIGLKTEVSQEWPN